METILNNVLDFLRAQYPQGTRVRIRANAESDPSDMKAGDIGALEYIDDAGKFHVRADDGVEVGLTTGRDKFDILPPEITALKLYMPMTADVVNKDEDEDENVQIFLDGYDLAMYRDKIAVALERERTPDEAARGVMRRYHEPDGVSLKVLSAEFKAEVRDERIWCVTDCKVMGRLTPEELDALKGFISDQASDSWGKSFEQKGDRNARREYVRSYVAVRKRLVGSDGRGTVPRRLKKAEPDEKRGTTR